MLAKLTSKNQITLPKEVMRTFQNVPYFEVHEENGRIVLTPARIQKADAVREKLSALNITEKDIDEAVRWARKK